MKSSRHSFPLKAALICVGSLALAGWSHAQIVPTNVDSSDVLVDFSADSLANGSSVSSWASSSGSISTSATSATATATSPNTYNSATVGNTIGAFNGHNYVNFNTSSGHLEGFATTTNLGLTGTSNMSVAAVYATPTGSTPDDAGLAGLADENAGGHANQWFDLEDRTFIVTGDPYLAGYANDLNSGGSPSGEAGVLTFALGTYVNNGDGSATFSLYWAYGLTGAVQSTSETLNAVDTTAANFEIGYNAQDYNAGAGSPVEVGQALAWDSALSAADATTEIENLQAFYAEVPEPSTYALIGASLLAGLVFLRRCARA